MASHEVFCLPILAAKATSLSSSCGQKQKLTVCGNPSILGHRIFNIGAAEWLAASFPGRGIEAYHWQGLVA
jgi:hypothetical protein